MAVFFHFKGRGSHYVEENLETDTDCHSMPDVSHGATGMVKKIRAEDSDSGAQLQHVL
jgi:hypothetical protein